MHLLPGTTFSSAMERGEYDSEGKAVMTIGELEVWFALQVTGGYQDPLLGQRAKRVGGTF